MSATLQKIDGSDEASILQEIQTALRNLRFGSVEITVHNGQIVQIDTTASIKRFGVKRYDGSMASRPKAMFFCRAKGWSSRASTRNDAEVGIGLFDSSRIT